MEQVFISEEAERVYRAEMEAFGKTEINIYY
jgi:hypothetical protein